MACFTAFLPLFMALAMLCSQGFCFSCGSLYMRSFYTVYPLGIWFPLPVNKRVVLAFVVILVFNGRSCLIWFVFEFRGTLRGTLRGTPVWIFGGDSEPYAC